MLIPKSIKCQSNLNEAEIRAYFSLKPLDEDYSDHDKRFSKILNEYLETRSFKDNNARLCYKKQLKRMNKEGKTNTPKFSAFNMWRLKEIEKNISRQKTYLLEREGKVMPKRAENNNQLVDENNKLKLEIEKLKKQLIDKDNQIDFLMTENTKMKHMPQEEIVEEKPLQIHEIKECLIIETSEEEESAPEEEEEQEYIYADVVDVVEDLVNKVITVREALDDSDDEDDEEGIEVCKVYFKKEVNEESIEKFEKEDEVRPIEEVEKLPTKEEAIELFQKDCIKMIDEYHQEYMKLKKGKNDKETCKIKNNIFERYDDEVIQPKVEKLDDDYYLENEEYTQVQEKPYEKMKDMILYFSD